MAAAPNYGQTLDEILRDEILLGMFAQYMQQAFCLENLTAWVEIEEYKRMIPGSMEAEAKVRIFS